MKKTMKLFVMFLVIVMKMSLLHIMVKMILKMPM